MAEHREKGTVITVEEMVAKIARSVATDSIGQVRAAVFFYGAAFRETLKALEILRDHVPEEKLPAFDAAIERAQETAAAAVRIGMNLSTAGDHDEPK